MSRYIEDTGAPMGKEGRHAVPLAGALPEAAFIDPHGSNRDPVERLARRVLDLVIEHAATAAGRSPLPDQARELDYALLLEPPASEQALLDRLRCLMAASANLAHPGYIGHMDPPPTTASILGDLVAAALNNNMLFEELSPALSRLEQHLVRQMGQRVGWDERAGGVLLSGGTLANLQALAVARNVAFEAVHRRIGGLDRLPVVLASEAAHTSIRKAAMLLGLGADAVILVPVDANVRMDVEALRQRLEAATRAEQAPFCIVATAGTTVTGNIDLLAEVAAVARETGLWFHVDAAYGGALIFSPRHRHRLRGIAHADSVTFNPQKWLNVARTSAMVLFRDRHVLDRAFRLHAPYAAEGEAITNIGEISSLPTFRGCRWLRAVLANPYTDEAVLDRLFAGIDAFTGRA